MQNIFVCAYHIFKKIFFQNYNQEIITKSYINPSYLISLVKFLKNHFLIYLFICLFIYLVIYLFIQLVIYLFIYSFIYLFIYLFIHLFIYLLIHLFIYIISFSIRTEAFKWVLRLLSLLHNLFGKFGYSTHCKDKICAKQVQRRIQNPVEHRQRSFFTKIVNG